MDQERPLARCLVALVLLAVACKSNKARETPPAPAGPVRLYTDAEIVAFQTALDARLHANQTRHCVRPVLRGATAPGSAHDDLVALAAPRGSLAECLQRFTSAKAAKADAPVFDELDRDCGQDVETAIVAEVAHEDACSPYQVGVGVMPEALAPMLRSADAIGARARGRAARDPVAAILLVADAIRAYQDLSRGETNLVVAMIAVAAENNLLEGAHEILDHAHLAAPQAATLATTFDALLASEPSFGDTMLGEADAFDLFMGYAHLMPADWTPPGGWDPGLRALEQPDLGTKTDPRDEAALMMEWSELRRKGLATACPSAGTIAICYRGLGDIATRTASLKAADPAALALEMQRLAGSGDADAARHHLRDVLVGVLERVAAASFQPYAAKRASPIVRLASARIALEVVRLGHCPPVATLAPLLAPAMLGEPLVATRSGTQLTIAAPDWTGATPWIVSCP